MDAKFRFAFHVEGAVLEHWFEMSIKAYISVTS